MLMQNMLTFYQNIGRKDKKVFRAQNIVYEKDKSPKTHGKVYKEWRKGIKKGEKGVDKRKNK